MVDEGLITPEAVRLEFETAGVPTRALARAIDLVIAGSVVLTLLSLILPFVATSEPGIILIGSLGFVLVFFVYPLLLEGLGNGRTLGKTILGLRVVTREGGPVRIRHAAIRSFLQMVDHLLPPLGTVAIASCLAGRSEQRLGDRLAGTIVVRATSGARDATAVAFPPLPGYEGYVAGLDVTSVRPEQYEVVRSFLTRVLHLSNESRVALAVALARPLAVQMHHQPPPNLHPEHFLASVAAAYQARHGGPATTMTWVPITPPPTPPPVS